MKLSVRPTLLDRAIAAVSPAAGVARMEARTRLAASTAMFGGQGGYRGGQGERGKRRGWFARARSANADTIPGADRRRAAERDAAMNQPIAAAALNRLATFTIGTGLMAIPAIDGAALGLTEKEREAWEQRIAVDFDAYMASKDADAERSATGYRNQAIVYRGANSSGDTLALRVMPEGQPGRVVETAWKLIEADRLRNPPTVMDGAEDPQTGNVIAGGVEVDRHGAPVAYHVLKQHPGDLVQRGGANLIPERIEAWDAKLALPRVIHVYRKERPEQLRGVGVLATVIEPLKMISDLTDAELFAAVLTSMVTIVYKSPGGGAMPEPDFGDGGSDQAAGGPSPAHAVDQGPGMKLEPGLVYEIDSEAEIDMKSPGRPNSAFDPFFQAIVRQIGAAIGVPAGVLMLMFNSSYTASKAELEALYLHVRAERAWMGDDWCKAPYVCFIAEKVARGDYVMPGFFSDLRARAAWTGVDWRGDGKISLNIAQEANGLKIQQDNNWKTGEQITAELTGGNYRENLRKRGAEHRALLAEGLPVAVSPGTPAGNVQPATQGDGDKSGQDDQKKEDE